MIKELFNLEVSPCCLQKTLRTFTGHRSSGVEQQFRKLQVSGSIPLGGSSQLNISGKQALLKKDPHPISNFNNELIKFQFKRILK